MRIIGALNIVFGVLSFWFFAGMIQMHWGKWPSSATGNDWAIFFLIAAISTYLVAHLGYCGIRLIKLDESALLPCILLFALEMLGFLLSTWILWLILPRSMNKVIFGLWEIALSPIAIEVAYGYSFLGFLITVALLLSRRSVRTKVSGDATATERDSTVRL
jgi:hypothetical protein